MSKEKTPYNPTVEIYSSEKPSEIHSSESEASDSDDLSQANNHSNIFKSILSKKSIDLNNDDDKNIDII